MQREGLSPVVVHGGGKVITEWMAAQNVRPVFRNGLRVTDADSLKIVVAVLAGLINKELVAELSAVGGRALGLSGADGGMLTARVKDAELGYVGEVVSVDATPIRSGAVVRVHPPSSRRFAVSTEVDPVYPNSLLNVNADTVAGEIACAMESERLLFLTDVSGRAGQGSPGGAEDDGGTGEGAYQRGHGIRGYDSKDRRMSARFEQWEHIADNRRERAGRASAVPSGRSVWDTDWVGVTLTLALSHQGRGDYWRDEV